MIGPEEIVVIAIGNRMRGDDAVGPIVADRLRGEAEAGMVACTIVEGRDDAMALISAWENAALAIVIDAAVSGAAPGTIRRLETGDQPLPKEWASFSSHGLGLAEAVELGRVLQRLPRRLVVFAIEAADLEAGAPLSPQVAAAVDEVVRRVEKEIMSFAGLSVARV